MSSMRRIQELHLRTWLGDTHRKPLLLRGARQVGKSTLVRHFAKNEGLDLIEINLEDTSLKCTKSENLSVDAIVEEVLLRKAKQLGPKSLLFFDEIQEDPKLLQWLRYFYEQRPELPVIAAGSLLEVALRVENFSFPVGRVTFLHMGPMTFQEFLWAHGQTAVAEQVIVRQKWSAAADELLKPWLKKYLFVGGMPEAVLESTKNFDLQRISAIHDEILQTYASDFPKYHRRVSVERIRRIFENSAHLVGKKVKFAAFDPLSKAAEVRRVLELLVDAKILLPVFHAECGGVPLAATEDVNIWKNYFLDVGLMNRTQNLSYAMLDDEFSKNLVSKGAMAEQFVAQHLSHVFEDIAPARLHYWLRDKGAQKGEIDFVLQHESSVVPLEVKAEQGGRLKSLFFFALEKKWTKALKFSLLPFSQTTHRHEIYDGKKNHTVEIEVLNIPLYGIEALPRILEKYFA
jgi:uncharacterized protein